MDNILHQKTSNCKSKYFCNNCNFKCSKLGDYSRHILTAKHKKIMMDTEMDTKKHQKTSTHKYCEMFVCTCGKEYKYKTGLYKHKKTCTHFVQNNKNILEIESSSNIKIFPGQTIIMDVLKQNQDLLMQNQEFKELLMDQNKQNVELQKKLLEMAKEGKHIITNNNNNKFNLNFFLHEQCKDAMNITDFVNSLQLQLSDLENVGELGYAAGISKIFINGLKQLDIFKRPIHCSDIKRETMYIKDKDAWEKENQEREKMMWAIKHIAHKNVKQIPEWQGENPEYKNGQSNIHEQFLKIVSESMGGHTEEDDKANYNKIIRNVAKEVSIDKI